jgi:hypothetical protein
VINNRPDFEAGPDQPTNADIQAAATAAGLAYAYLPVAPAYLTGPAINGRAPCDKWKEEAGRRRKKEAARKNGLRVAKGDGAVSRYGDHDADLGAHAAQL